MSKQPTYDFITKKLGRRSAPDTNALWQQMEQVLDREMPQDKKRRFFWLFPLNVWLIVFAVSGIAATTYHFIGTNGKTKTAETTQTNETSQAPTRISTGAPSSTGNSFSSNSNSTTNTTNNTTSSTVTAPVTTATSPAKPATGKASSPVIHQQNTRNRTNGNATRNRKQQSTKTSSTRSANTTGLQNDAPSNEAQPATNSEATPSKDAAAPPVVSRRLWTRFDGTPHQPLTLQPLAAAHNDIARNSRALSRRDRGFTAGIGLQHNVATGDQAHSRLGYDGSAKTEKLDYLPSVFVRYHFNSRWSVQAQLQWMTPQYVKQFTMYEEYSDASANHYREESITLQKLYYTTAGLTAQYRVLPHLQLGAGIEYAYLRRSVFAKQSCLWQQDAGTWWKPWEDNTTNAMENVNKAEAVYGAASTPMDTAAYSIKPRDWRVLLSASYQWRRLQVGAQASAGITPYINTVQQGYYNNPVRDVNRSLQFFLRYNLFDNRKK